MRNTRNQSFACPRAWTLAIVLATTFIVSPRTFGQGSCCIFPGDCIEIGAVECNAQGGSFNGTTTICFEGSCDPQGACVSGVGTGFGCEQITESICNTRALSTFSEGVRCTEVPDGGEGGGIGDGEVGGGGGGNGSDGGGQTGACCFSGNDFLGTACEQRTELDCGSVGGFFAGGSCDDADCDPTACCVLEPFFNGGEVEEIVACRVLPGDECTLRGGDSVAGESCDGVDCSTGACCRASGACEVVARELCDEFDGVLQPTGDTFQGASTKCEGDTLLACGSVGACCLADGSCKLLDFEACRAEPDSSGEVDTIFAGAGVACGDDVCFDLNFVACCFIDSACNSVASQEVCESLEGGVVECCEACSGGTCEDDFIDEPPDDPGSIFGVPCGPSTAMVMLTSCCLGFWVVQRRGILRRIK